MPYSCASLPFREQGAVRRELVGFDPLGQPLRQRFVQVTRLVELRVPDEKLS
jgi:hypothetical protein